MTYPAAACQRRYYVAEGVRLYSQETWRTVMGDSGRDWVAKCAPQVGSWSCELGGVGSRRALQLANKPIGLGPPCFQWAGRTLPARPARQPVTFNRW